ncbi:MAG: serine hydrolase [Steroidobacteraceae bacterium]
MQRTLVLITLLGLVVVSVAIGALASNWPFWSRALAWQNAAQGWPDSLGGPRQTLQAGAVPPLQIHGDAALDELAASTDATVLLVGAGGQVRAHFAAGNSADSLIDGRGLSAALPALLVGVLASQRPALLDTPVGELVKEWAGDPRGAITSRQLLWQLSGLPAGPFHPLDPFSDQAALRSGPDFRRAVLGIGSAYPPGSHFEPSPANAQLLALVAEAVTGQDFATALQQRLWSAVASRPAQGLLDHRRGMLAAHCCFIAAAGDWLRLGLLLAGDARAGARQLLSAEYLAELLRQSPVHPGYGLGLEIQQGAQGVYLVLQSSGRLLAAAPGRGRALFWYGGELTPRLRSRLLQELER